MSGLRAWAMAAVVFVLGYSAALAQTCGGQWLPGDGIPGINGEVYATTMWDPDGPGPQPPVLVAAGQFTFAGEVAAYGIAAWDGSRWTALGTGISTLYVRALAVLLGVSPDYGAAAAIPADLPSTVPAGDAQGQPAANPQGRSLSFRYNCSVP
jgi:hypothetical protein